MSKAIVVFGSTTGSTEMVAGVVKKTLEGNGAEVTLKNVTDASINEVGEYDLIVLGSSTWGEGDIQDDFLPFYEEMDSSNLGKKNVAVFGCGDSDMFPHCFCAAVDKIREKAVDCGANLVCDGLKIDGDVGAALGEVKAWAEELAA